MVSDKSSSSNTAATTTTSTMGKRNKLKSVQTITAPHRAGNGHNNNDDDNDDDGDDNDQVLTTAVIVDDSTTINGTRGGLGQDEDQQEEQEGIELDQDIEFYDASSNNNNNSIDSKNIKQDLEHNQTIFTELVTTTTIDCWRSREDPLEWSIKILPLLNEFEQYTIYDNHQNYILCEILIQQMHVGVSPSPLLVSYLRYAIATKMVFTTHLCDLLYQYAQPDRSKHFSAMLSVISDIVNLPSDSFNSLPPFIKKRNQSNNNNKQDEEEEEQEEEEEEKVELLKDDNNKRKRQNGRLQDDDDEDEEKEKENNNNDNDNNSHLLKKRKNQIGSHDNSVYEKELEQQDNDDGKEDIQMNDGDNQQHQQHNQKQQQQQQQKKKKNHHFSEFKEEEAVPKLMVILFKGLIYYFNNNNNNNNNNVGNIGIDMTTILGNGIVCSNLISAIVKNQAVSSAIYFCQHSSAQLYRELSDMFVAIEQNANRMVIPYGISNIFNLELVTNIKSLLFTPYLPHEEIKYLAYDNSQLPINQDQSIIFQLLLEELITGTRLSCTTQSNNNNNNTNNNIVQTEDTFYKLVCYRTLKNMTYTNFIFEIVRTLIQRLSLCMMDGATSAQFKKVKMVLLYRIPKLYESLIHYHNSSCGGVGSGDNIDTPIGSMEGALHLVLQICPELEGEVILPLIFILIRKNLVSSTVIKDKFPSLTSDIESLEYEIQQQQLNHPSAPSSPTTIDSLYSSSFQIRTLNDIKTIKFILKI
ncbi:hypothetical protein DFA_04089 [Cavenderia fasciculata]|uniref:Uncharacterized protein n=1 Tax=Cavenderia fasciculata TaxID=261658 RepID=F4Q194_CACFS|nr:uncharacterized protein DFA_04089 [Cavenderia fasciculata]EGG18595.1 hypothetical protein DFA_04089 [Cavenderia fasciculata]|eukprot:XP_004366499.1 hypothetical protein DFA_04089 [Cavenderia fasciculata]